MTLKRLKTLAIVTPIVGVTVLETVRFTIVGFVSWEKRVVLDLIFR